MTAPNNPGDPSNTDEENISPLEAETLEAEEVVDAEADSLVDDALADPDVAADAAQAEEAEAVDEAEASDVETQLAERTEDLQRVSAEYANYRRRTERERAGIIATAKASVLTQLLPILDDLDLARQHGDLAEGPLKGIGDKLEQALKGQQLESFGAEGEAFDPEIHEAVQDLSSGDDKFVGTVLRKGYRVQDKVVRTAMVIIADPAGQPESEPAKDSDNA
ncbi:nucleotide exchange factor GrpE [Corynebacterium tapiri]|uniref:Protein GrpE n=1 Tax=Corynebacterium tapiri TaxID=1448266 RepID=A0A5C4U1S7_9CORY|nr:nucleotide exchange factor GrpE [Corynebacterium tapiri]TNL95713.1 nucleotide exchange factor GrpE [Corynebacterium tapiri]